MKIDRLTGHTSSNTEQYAYAVNNTKILLDQVNIEKVKLKEEPSKGKEIFKISKLIIDIQETSTKINKKYHTIRKYTKEH